jgi:antitoxin component of MazEF toxin-antitoxin module
MIIARVGHRGKSLWVSIPRKLARLEGIKEGDRVTVIKGGPNIGKLEKS